MSCSPRHPMHFEPPFLIKLSVGVACHAYLLEIEGLFTRGSQPGRTVGELVGGILAMGRSDWSSVIRHIPSIPDPTLN
jgi:hypothetical protein